MLGLTYIRKLFNMSMEDLATKLNVSKQTISKWENKKISISKERLQQLEKIFNIKEEFFQKDLQERDEVIIQTEKVLNEVDTNNIFDTDDNVQEQKDKLKTMSQLIVHTVGLSVKDEINNIFDEAYKTKDIDLISLYKYFNTEVSNLKLDRKIMYSMLKSIHENYSPSEERIDITSDCDMELVSKLNNLLQEYKNKKD